MDRELSAAFGCQTPLLENTLFGTAGDETRTRDVLLGKEVLYQLSYTRILSG